MITVIIVEDKPIIRESLAILLNGTEGINCLAVYESCEYLFAQKEILQKVDIILMDIELPGMSGIEGVRKIKSEFPGIDILILTIYEDNQKIYDALCAGATGYLLKRTPPAQLLQAITETYNGGSPMSSQIARKVVDSFHFPNSVKNSEDHGLSEREKQVISCLADGKSYQEVADQLFISIETVRQHIKNIYQKLHVHTQSGAVAIAFRKGIIK
ncbi:MAG: response regulator transcription factor [Ignavibacteria bacterium]|nr:response regulator transcription factor [Ignavibacteria bacterium]